MVAASQLLKKHQDLQVGLELEEEVVGLRRRGQAGWDAVMP